MSIEIKANRIKIKLSKNFTLLDVSVLLVGFAMELDAEGDTDMLHLCKAFDSDSDYDLCSLKV